MAYRAIKYGKGEGGGDGKGRGGEERHLASSHPAQHRSPPTGQGTVVNVVRPGSSASVGLIDTFFIHSTSELAQVTVACFQMSACTDNSDSGRLS